MPWIDAYKLIREAGENKPARYDQIVGHYPELELTLAPTYVESVDSSMLF